MDTKPAFIAAVVEALNQDNYLDWCVRVKTCLMAQGLWGIVESPENEAGFMVWNMRNAMALHVIQNSCGPDTFSNIREITSAKIAWETLAGKYKTSSKKKEKKKEKYKPQGPDPSSSMAPVTFGEDKPSSSMPSVLLEKDNIDPGEIDIEGNIDDAVEVSAESDIEESIDYNVIYDGIYNKLVRGDWDDVSLLLNRHPQAISAIISVKEQTALHVAVEAGNLSMVAGLVNRMSAETLEIRDNEGFTALGRATCSGNYGMAECMVRKSVNLTGIEIERGYIPVVAALYNGHLKLASFLYLETPEEILTREDGNIGATVVCEAIYNKALDIALHLVSRCPRLVFAKDRNGDSPFYALACMPDYFQSVNRLVFWKRWIYYGFHIHSGDSIDDIRLNIQNLAGNQSDNNETSGSGLYLWSRLVSNLQTLFGIKHLYEMRRTFDQSQGLLVRMICELRCSNIEQMGAGRVQESIIRATKEGIFEFVASMLGCAPLFVWTQSATSSNIFSGAVAYRHAKIFDLICHHRHHHMRNALASSPDFSGNNLLHMAGTLAASTSLNDIPGAALKMQREVQWFKEVESIVPPLVHRQVNSMGLTPRQFFTKNHEDLMSKGEKWMKDTASSCTVVGALIVTIMFAVVFTVPGGNQNNGFPIFSNKKLFKVFIVSDALSLFSSATSVLMFLGILTSRYAEEDFLESLPRKMIIGLSALFFSIVAMMTTFSVALLLLLHEQSWIFEPIICLACIPVTLFVLMQFPLLVAMAISTYGPSIFYRKKKRWF